MNQNSKNIQELDEMKAKAIDCLQKRQKPEATQHYIEMYKTYKHRASPDASLAVLFNMLLSSLEQQTENYSNQVDSLCNEIASIFQHTEPTYLTIEISKRIQILFQEPILEVAQDVAQRLIDSVSQHYQYVSPISTQESPIILDNCIRANTIAQLYPEDSALLCFLMIDYAKNKDKLSSWLHPLHKLFLNAEEIPQEIQDKLNFFQYSYSIDKFAEAYQALLICAEWAVTHHPLYASEWMIGLDYLEDQHEAQLRMLDYKTNMPKEHKVILSLQFHLKLAQVLSDEAGAERLSLHHWQMVYALGDRLKLMIAEREQKFSAHSSEVDKKAQINYWMALSCLAQGEFTQAIYLLEYPLDIAKRKIIKDVLLSADILYLSGSVYERIENAQNASSFYINVIDLLCPHLFQLSSISQVKEFCDQYSVFCDQLFAKNHQKAQNISRCILLVSQSISALLRLGYLAYSPLLLNIYRAWLYYFRYILNYQDWVEALLYLELAACYCREYRAPLKALEIARALNHRSAIVLSIFYQILEQIDQNPNDVQVWQRLNQDFKRLMLEAKKAGGGNIQRMANVAGILLQLKKAKLEESAPTEEFENQISEALDLIQDSILSDKASMLDVFLPAKHQELNLEHHIIELIKQVPKPTLQENTYVRIAKFLCTISRGLSKHFHHVTPYRDFADKIRNWHHGYFMNKWINRGHITLESYKFYDDLLSRRETSKWPRRNQNNKEIRIEYQVFDDSFVVFLIKQHQIVLAKQVVIPRHQLANLVHNYRMVLINYPESLNEQSLNLYSILLSDFDQEITYSTRLIIVPDGPLKDLPFSTLKNPHTHQFLAQRIDMAIACPTTGPVFAANKSNLAPNHLVLITDETEIGSLFSANTDFMIEMYPVINFIRTNQSPNTPLPELLMVYLNAVISSGPSLEFNDYSCPLGDMINELANRRASFAVLNTAVHGELGHTAVRALLTSLYHGLVAKQWEIQGYESYRYQIAFLKIFFTAAIKSNSSLGLIDALTSARRMAISEKIHPRDWANFEIFISDRQ